ncbi:DNA polymerase III subunit beta [Hymenobacter aerilatus]|uniref:Beta sliding clamp n=1 Tax=Hymenobacter aerilatus TaxID=2932251 RepID=A0A8T9T2D9_9BACT|nr:DNA polymerase III subunit beta [Hymenobacter aerilatus]UOR06266.1 DNA polymerase III subunit beta [Hymenobacter aerilatus]
MATVEKTLVATTSKFIASGAALLRVAQHAQLAAPKNQPIVPILENLLLSVAGSQLTFTGYDLEHRFTSCPLPIERRGTEDVHVCVRGRQLIDLLKNLPDQPLTLAVVSDESKYPSLHVHAVTDSLGFIPTHTATARYEMSGDPGHDYPAAHPMGKIATSFTLPGHVLLAALQATLPVTSRDELRPAMTGILVTVNAATIEFAATDGHRLVAITKDDEHVLSGEARSFILPHKAAELLLKLVNRAETIELLVGASQLLVKMERGELQVRLLDEKYPDYKKVIPADNPNMLTVHRVEMLAAIKRCQLFAPHTMHQVRFILSPAGCQVEAENKDEISKATESVPGTYEGADMTIGFNANFLRFFLEKMPCQSVRINMGRNNQPGVFTSADASDGLLCLLMPVMLTDYNAR